MNTKEKTNSVSLFLAFSKIDDDDDGEEEESEVVVEVAAEEVEVFEEEVIVAAYANQLALLDSVSIPSRLVLVELLFNRHCASAFLVCAKLCHSTSGVTLQKPREK